MVTSKKYDNASLAPIAIGLALAHYWVCLLAPLVGLAIASFAAKFMGSEEI